MAQDPRRGDVKRPHGRPGRWRRRVGNFRIFYAIDDDARVVEVGGIERRTSTTY
jgi:mRNA-degrading endonuclease RelE of RelBE toxin-antitoxin system